MLKPWAYLLCGKKAKKADNSAICNLGIVWFTWKSGAQISPQGKVHHLLRRQSKAITTAMMWDAKICNQTTGIPLLYTGYRVTRSCPALEQRRPGLATSGLWRAATDAGCLPLQELIQPGECSFRGGADPGPGSPLQMLVPAPSATYMLDFSP